MAQRIKLPDGRYANFPDGMPMSEIETVLQRQFPPTTTRAARLAELTRQAQNEQAVKTQEYLKGEGGLMENLGAGANSAKQATKNLFGMEGAETDEQIKERRKIDERLAEGQAGGSTMQVLGEIGAQAPLSLATGGAGSVLTKAVPWAAKAAGWGGKVANLGNVARGAVEGATSGALQSTTSDESRAGNVGMGLALGGAIPAALGGTGKLLGGLSTSEARVADRAARALRGEIGSQAAFDEVTPAIMSNTRRLPLSTAAITQNPNLGRMARGARSRGVDDTAAQRDIAVNREAARWFDEATAKRSEVDQRLSDQKAILDALRAEVPDVPSNLRKFNKAQTEASKAIDDAREHSSGRILVDPQLNGKLSNIQTFLTQPSTNPRHFEAAADQIMAMHQDTNLNPPTRELLKNLEQQIRNAGDSVKGQTSVIKMAQGSETDLVKQAQAAKDIYSTRVTPEGVVLGKAHDNVPTLTGEGVASALGTHGEDQYGKLLHPDDWESLNRLAQELRLQDIHSAGSTPGATSIAHDSMAQIPMTGRNNWINIVPGVKGAYNATLGRLRNATESAVDKAVLNPDDWIRMAEQAHALRNRNPEGAWMPQNKMTDFAKWLNRAPANAMIPSLSGD